MSDFNKAFIAASPAISAERCSSSSSTLDCHLACLNLIQLPGFTALALSSRSPIADGMMGLASTVGTQ